jgi:hypothetical protein
MKLALFAGIAALALAGQTYADDAPRDYVAQPDVYNVVARGQHMLVIEIAWKPHQRDTWHSHAANAGYWLTPCKAKTYTPDGQSREFEAKAGGAFVQPAIPSHSFENTGDTDCRLVMFEQE